MLDTPTSCSTVRYSIRQRLFYGAVLGLGIAFALAAWVSLTFCQPSFRLKNALQFPYLYIYAWFVSVPATAAIMAILALACCGIGRWVNRTETARRALLWALAGIPAVLFSVLLMWTAISPPSPPPNCF